LKKLKSEVSEIDGVIRFKIDIPWDVKFVCIYLFEIDGVKVLIDAGLNFIDWSRLFFLELKNLKIEPKDIDYCIVSHAHMDHVGLIQKLKRKNPEMQLLMHEITNETIKWSDDENNDQEMKNAAIEVAEQMIRYGISEQHGKRIVQFFTSWPKLTKYQKPDRILKDGDEIPFETNKLKIIWTPGHSLGHICVYEEKNRRLFSGDHILSRITPHIGVFTVSPAIKNKYPMNNILGYYLESLDRIDKLDPKIIFPAHQEVIYNPHERILAIKEHHKNRLNDIFNAIQDKPLTPFKISQIHFGEDLNEINMFLALNEVLSHLIYLEHDGRVKRIEQDGKILFSAIT